MVDAPAGPPPARRVRSRLPPPRPWRRQRLPRRQRPRRHHRTVYSADDNDHPRSCRAAAPNDDGGRAAGSAHGGHDIGADHGDTDAAPTPAPAAAVTPARAESFVRDYFDAVAAGDYACSWSQLTPEFQHGKARSYEYYVGFWDDNDIAVDDVELVDADPSKAIVDVVLRWNGSSDATTDRFELRRGPDGQLLIARQDTIAR